MVQLVTTVTLEPFCTSCEAAPVATMSANTPGEETVQALQSPTELVTVLMNVGVSTGGVMVNVNCLVTVPPGATVMLVCSQVEPSVVHPGEVLQPSPTPV
ncbi:hypothetical protein D3C72_1422990 [compost metagenome]